MMSHLLAFVNCQKMKRELQASTELIGAIGGQPLSESHGRQHLKRYTRFIQKYPNLILKDLGTSKGLTMYLLSDTLDRAVVLYNGQKVVAYGKLEDSPHDKTRKTMYNLYVSPEYRNKGLATVIHLGALHVYKKLMSDTTMAMGALNAFRSLEKFGYKLKMRDIESGNQVAFKWGSDGIPEVEGHTIIDEEKYALYV